MTKKLDEQRPGSSAPLLDYHKVSCKIKVGGPDFLELYSTATTGTDNLSTLFAWPQVAWNKLVQSADGIGRQQLFMHNACRGVNVLSYYSGKGTDGTVAMHLNKLLQDFNYIDYGERLFTCSHACDADPVCQQLLSRMMFQNQRIYSHVFGDVGGRIALLHQNCVAGFFIKDAELDHAKLPEQSLGKIMDYFDLLAQNGSLYNFDVHLRREAVDDCVIHGGLCCVHDHGMGGHASSASTTPQKRRRIKLKEFKASARKQTNPSKRRRGPDENLKEGETPIMVDIDHEVQREVSALFGSDEEGWDSEDQYDNGHHPCPMSFFVAGSSCEDFARYGERLGSSGPKMKAWVMFAADIKAQKPDCGLFENSDVCPLSFYQETFGDQFEYMSAILSPVQFGWPCKRPRRYTFVWNPENMVNTGSFEEMLEMFACVPALFGDCFLLASKEERQAYMRERAAVHGQHFPDGDQVPLSSCFSPKENLEILHTTMRWESKASMSGVCIRDLEQSLQYMDASPFVPTLLKHGKIISIKRDPNENTMFLPRELMAAMGEPCFAPCRANGFESYAWNALGDCNLRKNDVVKMSGNAMHVAVLGHVMMYCFSSVARRQGASLRCELRCKEENDDDRDELIELLDDN